MIPAFIRRLFHLDNPPAQLVCRQLPPSPDVQQELAEAETREMNTLAESETQEILPEDLEALRRTRAYFLAEADGFRQHPDYYWAEAARR